MTRKIEIGKTYTTRDGSLDVTIEAETGNGGAYRMRGRDNLDRLTWRSATGRFAFGNRAHPLDLMIRFDCPLCGQHITDGKPCGCGAR
jgi:hypothetical protein